MTLSTMSINAQMSGADQQVFYTDGLRNALEDALTWLISHPLTTAQVVDPGIAYRFEADFYGMLNYYNVPYQFHWLIMRMTGFVAPEESPSDLIQFLKPDFNTVQQIVSLYNTGQN
jgi:hypothetical protein